MIGLKEPSGEEIARRAHELYLQRGGEHWERCRGLGSSRKRAERRTCRGTSEDESRPSSS